MAQTHSSLAVSAFVAHCSMSRSRIAIADLRSQCVPTRAPHAGNRGVVGSGSARCAPCSPCPRSSRRQERHG